MVSGGLLQDALPDSGLQRLSMEPPLGDLFPAVKTAFQPAVRRYPDTAAGCAEIVADGGDESHRALCSRQTIPPGHALGR